MNPYRFRPRLEALEERAVPASIRLISDSLYISNQTATTLTLSATGTNTFTVQDGAQTVTNLRVGGTINVTGRALNDEIRVLMNGQTFTGNFLFNTGNGNDTIDFQNGDIRGNITMLTGYGDDSVALGRNGGAALTIGGTIQLVDQLGNDSVAFGNDAAASLFQGDVTLTGANNITVGAGQADRFGRDLTMQSLQDGRAVTVLFNDGATVDRQLSISGGLLGDSVEFLGTNTIRGHAEIMLGSGVDSIAIGNNAPVDFQKNLTIDMGEGSNSYDLDAPFNVDGNLTIRAGHGDNLINNINATIAGDLRVGLGNGLNNVVLASSGLVVAGNVYYTNGNGDFSSFTLANGTVAGDVVIHVGNGANFISLNDPALLGSTFRVRTGNGNNSVTIATLAVPVDLDILLGSGNDTVTFFPNVIVSGRIDGGGGENTLDDFGAIYQPYLTIANFP